MSAPVRVCAERNASSTAAPQSPHRIQSAEPPVTIAPRVKLRLELKPGGRATPPAKVEVYGKDAHDGDAERGEPSFDAGMSLRASDMSDPFRPTVSDVLWRGNIFHTVNGSAINTSASLDPAWDETQNVFYRATRPTRTTGASGTALTIDPRCVNPVTN